MTVDLLSQRLKAAKRELTALKTAHRRGLGLLKVYTYTGQMSPPTPEDDYAFRLTITFSENFAKNPFVYILRETDDPTRILMNSQIEIDEQHYSSDGYSLVVLGYLIYFSSITNRGFKIISSAPIENLSWEWTLDA